MIALTTYECTGNDIGDGVDLYLPALSGNKVIDVIGHLGKSLLPSEYSIDENIGKLTINYTVQRGYKYSVLYKTLPRTGSGIIDGDTSTMTGYESFGYESFGYS